MALSKESAVEVLITTSKIQEERSPELDTFSVNETLLDFDDEIEAKSGF